mmetsp:Transcript_36461/g.79752  ORF Transcript_36461/g.79752 Transcript_36461/m.79752 type:complete len:275 (+) Transcript_36461:129-953(+)
MAAILQCIIRTCFDLGDEGGVSGGSSRPPTSRTMDRLASTSDSVGQYSPATIQDPHEVGMGSAAADELAGGRCCVVGSSRPSGGGAPLGAADALEEREDDSGMVAEFVREGGGIGVPGRGLHGLFARLGFGGGGRGYGSLVQTSDAVDGTPHRPVRESPSVSSAGQSPLRSASSFNYDKNMRSIPSIQLDEIVMPGSDLQKQMSAIMSQDLGKEDVGDECVICLEGFTAENPRMPTLCGCGENKAVFHLPCLYQWIEQDRNCPSCRKRLKWQEF